jgi:hypothetical protein
MQRGAFIPFVQYFYLFHRLALQHHKYPPVLSNDCDHVHDAQCTDGHPQCAVRERVAAAQLQVIQETVDFVVKQQPRA